MMQRAFSVWPLLLVLLGGAALAVCQWLIFFYAPMEAQLGLMQKVFYTHLPLAWWALISFLVVFVASIVYLIRRSPAADRVCAAAAEVGVLLAVVLFVKRVMETSSIDVLDDDRIAATENDEMSRLDDTEHLDIPAGVEVYEINGPFFFGLASRLEELEEGRKTGVQVRIIRMRKVSFMDSTGIRNLRNFFMRTEKRGIRVILSGVNPQVLATLRKFGLDREIGTEYIFPHIIPALAKANEYLLSVRKEKRRK